MDWLGAISAAIGLVALILKAILKDASKTDQARELQRKATENAERAAVEISEGKDIDPHVTDLLDDVDALLRLRQSAPTGTTRN